MVVVDISKISVHAHCISITLLTEFKAEVKELMCGNSVRYRRAENPKLLQCTSDW